VEYRPQLATLVKAPPAGDAWLHEIKFDGYRMGCAIARGDVRLTSRNGQDYTAAFPELVADARSLGVASALLDGEAVVLLESGRASFQALQQALSGTGSRAGLVYMAFDLLEIDGESLIAQPLEVRKARLQALIAPRQAHRIRFSDHVVGHGDAFFEQATKLGVEGIVSKRRDSVYQPGRRAGWLKIKCQRQQPFVIGGYTDQEGTLGGLGALLVGHYEQGRLAFAGRVGTGFTQKISEDLLRRLEPLGRKTSPFDPPPEGPLARTAHFVEPSLVCAVGFTEWTGDDRIRHPVYHGLVKDADPRRVARERD
jgi:bifunctional non-homologous end joining protein LigD